MTLDLANVTKADVYAAAQDLGERLARQIEINHALRAEMDAECVAAHKLEIELAGANEEIGKLQNEIDALASRPCLECDIVTPALRDRLNELEPRYEQACELLGQIDAGTVSVQWGSVVSFIEKRRELNAVRRPTEAAGSPV